MGASRSTNDNDAASLNLISEIYQSVTKSELWPTAAGRISILLRGGLAPYDAESRSGCMLTAKQAQTR